MSGGRVIATVCARGGSKGLPRKNLLPFAGLPLIAHSIRQALACPGIEGVYVSTDDEEIAQVARAHGAQVPVRRPAEMATDSAGKLPAIEHLVVHLEGQGERIATIVLCQPADALGALTAGHAANILPLPQHAPAVRLQPCQAAQQAAFARAIGADDGGEFARRNLA